ncbi:MAG: type II secretion system protein [Proteobacteria bacterium]|nr:type II secretion system protein [Pseudomonadota bacterium]
MFTKTETTKRHREGSFTLIETVIALAIIAFLIVEVAVVQGNAIIFSDYSRNIGQATYLARRVMSQVDYHWHTKPFKDLIVNQTAQKFEDFDEYNYSLEISEWKFPFVKLLETALTGGGKKKKEKDSYESRVSEVDTSGMSGMVEQVVKQIFADEPIFLIAKVEVSWPEGAQRNSTSMTYLLTNQLKLDEAIGSMKAVYDRLTKPPPKAVVPGQPVPPPPPPPQNSDYDNSGQPPPPPQAE